MKKYEYILTVRSFTWDSGHYSEHVDRISFKKLDQVQNFDEEFNKLPDPDWTMPYFGKFKSIEDTNKILKKYGKELYYDGGGVSIDMHLKFVATEEIEIF